MTVSKTVSLYQQLLEEKLGQPFRCNNTERNALKLARKKAGAQIESLLRVFFLTQNGLVELQPSRFLNFVGKKLSEVKTTSLY